MKARVVTFVAGFSAIAIAASLAIDLNGNGMSDVWEQKFAVPSTAAAAHYDGDGFTNQQESLLGTDPRDRFSRANLEMIFDEENGDLRLRIDTEIGKLYEVETSFDLLTWTIVASAIPGTGNPRDVITTLPPEAVERAFFRYRLTGETDADGDGLTGWEEHELNTSDINDDSDGDGISDRDEFQNGTDPADYYNGNGATLLIVGGDQQTAGPNQFLPEPLRVAVRGGTGQPLVNAPVTFQVTAGLGRLSLSLDGQRRNTLIVHTDSSGQATAYFMVPSDDRMPSHLSATADSSSVAFTEFTSYNLGPAAPSNCVVNFFSAEAQILWKDNSNDEAAFVVERSADSVEWESLATLPANTTNYVDSATQGTYYYYRITSTYGN